MMAHLPEEDFLDHEVQVGQIDAVKPYTVFHNRARPVVIPACQRQSQIFR